MADTKIGRDTAKYLRGLLDTPVFRHTGIVNADKDTTAWAARQETRSTFPLYPCQECIRWEDAAQTIVVDGITMMIIFTDGSASEVQ